MRRKNQVSSEIDIPVIAKDKFKNLAEELTKKKAIDGFELIDEDYVKLILYRRGGKFKVGLYVYPSGEVFSRKINDTYETFQTAYEYGEKRRVLEDMIDEAKFLNESNEYEEWVYSRNGRDIFREIRYADGSHESSSLVPAGRIRKLFGSTITKVSP